MDRDDKKPDRKRDMTTGLLRQRRNLISVSIIIILYYVGNIEISQLNFLGNRIKLGNPNVISYFLWLLFFYFFYRYWLYFKEEPKDRYDIDYGQLVDRLCTPIFKRIATKQNNQNHDEEKLKEILKFRQFPLVKSGNYNKLSMLKAESFGCNPASSSKENIHSNETVSAIYYEFCFIPIKIYACLSMAFRDSRFSDYYLPFLIALIAVLISITQLIFDEIIQ